MGLDMYLSRTKKVKGLSIEDYRKIDNAVSEVDTKGGKTPLIQEVMKGRNKKAYDELNDCVAIRGEYFIWYSIFDEVGYWRKVNAVHNFFVQRCQNGVDECQMSIVKKSDLQELLKRCKKVLRYKGYEDVANELLPTTIGFFFGGSDINEYYYHGIEETIETITEVLKNTDFKTQIIVYQASW
jgi:hypothetical protein